MEAGWLDRQQQGSSEHAADLEKGSANAGETTLLQARTEGNEGGVPEAEARSLLLSPKALSVTSSVLQRGGLSLFFFFFLVHAVCGVCSHLYRCAHVQQLVCVILCSLKSCKYKLYANFLNPIQKAQFLQLKCWILALFSVGKQRVNAIPSLEGTTGWQIPMAHQERLFCGSCNIMGKHLEYVQPKHEMFWDEVNIKRSWALLLPVLNFIGLTLLPGTNW